MIRLFTLARASLLFVLGLAAASASVELSSFTVRPVVPERGRGDWMEIEAELTVRSDPSDAMRRNARFLDGVSVHLTVAYEVNRVGAGASFEFFEAEALPVALVEGRNLLRFYLPPEIVDRDRLSGEPHSYLLEVRRGAQTLLSAPSRALREAAALSSFLSRARSDAPRNAGVMMPQNLTPFALYYPGATPSFRVMPGQF